MHFPQSKIQLCAKSKLASCTSLLLLACATSQLNAATIQYQGVDATSAVAEWRTSTTLKTLDIDGDNVYGTFGAVNWTPGSGAGAASTINAQAAGSTAPGWAYVDEVSWTQDHFANSGYTMIDDLQNPSLDTLAGIGAVNWPGSITFEMTGTAATYAGATVRIGFMADVLALSEWTADQGKTYQLTQTFGGSGDSGIISLRSGGSGNGQPEMYLFDVTGVSPGDRFTITAHSSSVQAGYVGAVSFDLIPTVIPEPSSALLGAAGLMAVLVRRRRQS